MSKISKATKVDCDIGYNSIHKSFILGKRDLLISGWQKYNFWSFKKRSLSNTTVVISTAWQCEAFGGRSVKYHEALIVFPDLYHQKRQMALCTFVCGCMCVSMCVCVGVHMCLHRHRGCVEGQVYWQNYFTFECYFSFFFFILRMSKTIPIIY